MDKRSQAVFLLLAAAVLWSTGGALIKGVHLPALAVAGFRSAIALPVLLIFFGGRAVNLSAAQLAGGVSYAATVILFVCATKLTTAGNAILLQYTAPVYVALLSGWLLKEKTRWFDWTAIAAVLFGMLLFFFDKLSAGGLAGNILAVISGFAFASLVLLLRMQKDASPAGSIIVGNLLTALVCLPWMAASPPGGTDWLGLALLGLLQLGLSYVFYAWAIKRVTAMEGILIPALEPVLNPLWVFCFVGERIGPWALFGGSVVMLSIFFRAVMHYRGTGAPPAEG
ncbi:MAG: DMT family transporter [Proteobacteria bacterium]|nr:DMT family transporter [Pseudomonadota bacterium]MBU2228365.1 DMT family transporter [Pseudomonadota bacterium]MBU2261557.1 DMT family transporter [Pseudomonadota bacterium]